MQDYWVQNGPPAYLTLAARYGLIKPAKKGYGDAGDDETGNLDELMGMFGEAGGLVHR